MVDNPQDCAGCRSLLAEVNNLAKECVRLSEELETSAGEVEDWRTFLADHVRPRLHGIWASLPDHSALAARVDKLSDELFRKLYPGEGSNVE